MSKNNNGFFDCHEQKRKRRIIFVCIFVAVIVGFITVSAVSFANLSSKYSKAVSLFTSGSYEEAKELFEEIAEKKYMDTEAYISFCEAHIYYDKGNISSAHYCMEKMKLYYPSEELSKAVEDFKATLEADYEVYLKEQAEARKKAYSERIANGVPYVGMLESEIKRTSLGFPSSNVQHNYERIDGKQYTTNIYTFKKGNATVFTARCARGVVIDVCDYRSKPIEPYTTKKKTNKEKDTYNVNDYASEEDFYDDHYDDFFDYYDAENYYNEHHD